MSSHDMNILMEMGFSRNSIEAALNSTGHKGIQEAMEWLLAHPDTQEFSSNDNSTRTSLENVASSSKEEVIEIVKSIKCDTCNKLFQTNLEVEFHASKSGHDKFSETTEEKKALSPQEKKHHLQILEEKLKLKRKEREEKEKRDELEKEKNRIRSGKEIFQAKKQLEELEIKKLLDQRKREKEDDKLARQKIRELIEADKMARKAKNLSETNRISLISKSSANSSDKSAVPINNYNETKLQIRLTNGQTIIQKFNAKEQLSAVKLYIEMNRTDESGPFILMTNFPKKIYTEIDLETPLDVLGLVPSAVIIVKKE